MAIYNNEKTRGLDGAYDYARKNREAGTKGVPNLYNAARGTGDGAGWDGKKLSDHRNAPSLRTSKNR